MTFEMSEVSRTVKVFNLRADTNEFIGGGDAYIPSHTGLPAHCTDIAPPEIPVGSVAVFNSGNKTWNVVEDHREQTIYSTETGEGIFIYELGPLPDNTTTLAPENNYQEWDGTAWVTNVNAMFADKAKAKCQQLIAEAEKMMSDWLVDLQLGVITDDDKSSLIKWRTYSKALNVMDLSAVADEESFNAVEWPDVPSLG